MDFHVAAEFLSREPQGGAKEIRPAAVFQRPGSRISSALPEAVWSAAERKRRSNQTHCARRSSTWRRSPSPMRPAAASERRRARANAARASIHVAGRPGGEAAGVK
jgi:hypothetical protein